MPDIYDVDLETGFLSRTLEDGTVVETTLGILGGNIAGTDKPRLSLEGTRIRDLETGHYVTGLNPNGLNRIEQLGDGRVLLIREINQDQINSGEFVGGTDAIGFDYQMTLATGEIIEGQVPFAFTGKVDSRLIVRNTDAPNPIFESIVPVIDPVTGEILNMPPDARLATADEASTRAMVKYLVDKNRDELERLAAQGITDEKGVVLETAYDVAAYIARQVIENAVALHVREL